MKKYLVLAILPFLLMMPQFAYASHVLDPAFGQYLDISQLESEKFVLEIDGASYDIYYGYHGSLDALGSESVFPTLSSMNINEENKSLEIIMSDVPEKTDFWVRMPESVIFAENEKFIVLVDGVETGYDLMKFPNDHVIGFFITEGTIEIEIIGTRVVPEFGTSVLILAFSILGLCFVRKYSLVSLWTRIN
jgi:hypothetical protein